MTDSTAGSGSQPCVQEKGEPNDSARQAFEFGGCSLEFGGAIGGDDLDDFYTTSTLEMECSRAWNVDVAGAVDSVCVEYECPAESTGDCSDVETAQGGSVACCAEDGSVAALPGCASGPPDAIYVHVRRASRVCSQYELVVSGG